ncbi:hypothetical protein BGZ83_007979 [Gryganskiella cystojenkinii]|nr:hypothetical protein BGZ83_007979 [Gryganskiella cystojenkinii]
MSSNKSPTPEAMKAEQQQQQQEQQDAGSASAVTDSTLSSSLLNGTATSTSSSETNSYIQQQQQQQHQPQQQQQDTPMLYGGSNGYLTTSTSQQQSTLPLISSPLAMNFGNHSNSAYVTNNNGANSRSSAYGYRGRNRRDSFQSVTNNNSNNLAFSPPSSYNSPSSLTAGGLVFNNTNHAAAQSRFSHLLNTPTGGAGPNGNSRSRCLSSSSMDSNASSVGFSRLTPAMAGLSVHHPHHQQQVSATNSPYQSYSSSPQSTGGFQYHYSQHQQQQQPSSTQSPTSNYPYAAHAHQSPFSSPVHQQHQQPHQYDSLSMAAATLTGTMYGSTPPTNSSDLLYPSTSSAAYGHVTSTPSSQQASYTSPQRSNVPFALAPSSYYDQDPTRLLQQLELNYENTYEQQQQNQQQPQRQYSTEHHQQQPIIPEHGLGIAISGGMVRASMEEHDTVVVGQDLEVMGTASSEAMVQLGSPTSPASNKKRGSMDSATESATETAANEAASAVGLGTDEPHAVLSEDGKTIKYLCSKCPRDFTTKSNLKRHLENINIHNTPYERTRDQKRWQGHEKKQASRAETTLRMRRWRQANREKNKFNDMRCRVYRNAKDKFGPEESDEKEAWIQAEIEKRKGMLLLRHSRKAGWKGIGALGGTTATTAGSNGFGYESGPSSPMTGDQLSDGSRFQNGTNNNFFNFQFGESASAYPNQIPAYGAGGMTGGVYDENAMRDDGLKEGDRKFIELLKTENGPRRRRSRQAMNATINREQQQNNVEGSNDVNNNGGGMVTRSSSGNHLMSMMSSSSSRNSLTSGSNKKRRSRKQRSISEAHTMMQRRAIAGTSPATLNNGANGSLYGIHGYIDSTSSAPSDQRLQELYQGVYQTRSLSQTLLMSKQQQQGQQQEMEAIVSGLDVQSPIKDRSTSGGLYGDRELSGWIDWQSSQRTATGDSNNASGTSRQYPFPEMTTAEPNNSLSTTATTLRDRKGLAKAAGIRIDIPNHNHQQKQQVGETSEWMMDDSMVGGSATTVESQGSSGNKSSPQSANSSLQSPMLLNHQPQQSQQHQHQAQYTNHHNTTTAHHPYHHHPYHIQEAGLIDATSAAHNSLKIATGAMSRNKFLHKAASHEMFSSGYGNAYGNSYASNNSSSGYPLQPFYGASTGTTGNGSFSLAQQAQVRSLQNAAQGLLSHNNSHLQPPRHHVTNPNNTGSGNGGDIDYFTTLVLPAVGDISVSSGGNAGGATASGFSGSGAMTEMPNYLNRQQQTAPRRHSTQLSNLSM